MRTLMNLAAALVASGALLAQATTWTSLQDRKGLAMASTPAGGVVIFGGERVSAPGQVLNDTHQLSSGTLRWSRRADGPGARLGHGMAGAMVSGLPKYFVFGGLTIAGQPTADTWVYDGSGWDPRGLGGVVPTARSAQGMVAGELAGPFSGTPRIWMFGGFSGTAQLGDLWSYQPDVDQWNLLGTTAGSPVGTWPAARSAHSLVFVPGTNPGDERLYLFGGRTGGVGFTNDLWRFNPFTNAWQQMLPPSSPPARRDAALAYVPGIGGLVLFGGRSASNSALGDTWIYDPSSNAWTQRTFSVSPPGRSGHAVTVDASGDKLVLVGGVDASGAATVGTWIFDSQAPGSPPGAWIEPLPVPEARYGAAMAFDRNASRNRHVMFGGALSASSTVISETWELDGLDWIRRTPTTAPSARYDAGLVYHAARDRMVLYGGRNPADVALGDTWEWNGTTWTVPTLTGSPPAAGGIQPVYDSARGRLVLPVPGAGGMETWVLQASAWTMLPTLVLPPARTNYGAAYDSRRDQIVLFGGMSSNNRATATYLGDTWIFDGSSWVRRFPEMAPSPRGWGRLAYDEARSRVVLFGGANATNVHEDTWEWDGERWIQESPATTPANPLLAAGHSMSFDPKRNVTVAHGGIGTWDYGPVATADVEQVGSGCVTSSGSPLALQSLPWSRLWLGEPLEIDIVGQPAASLGLMLWGSSRTELVPGVLLPLDLRLVGFSTGPCSLWTSGELATQAVFPGTTRYVSFAMPMDTFLLGLQVAVQSAYFDVPANGANPPAVTSNGLWMKLGQKGSLGAAPFEPNPALNMVRIGAGTFDMGSPVTPLQVAPYYNQAYSQPVHAVTITQNFWIGKSEVSQAEYQAVMGVNPSFFANPQRPVEQVTWFDAMAYCAALTVSETSAGRVPAGYQYRLPTEAEWEYACRGSMTTEFWLGSTMVCGQANFDLSYHVGAQCGVGQTTIAGSFGPNGYGLLDVSGNVWEWCLDSWDLSPNYPSGAVSDPRSTVGLERIIRGGSWGDGSNALRSAHRDYDDPTHVHFNIGLRVVLAPILVP